MSVLHMSRRSSFVRFLSNRPILFYVAIFLVFTGLLAGEALRKQPMCDEGWFFSPIHNFLAHGSTGTNVLDATGLPWAGVEKRTYWQVPVFFVVEALWMKMFGMSLWTMRSVAVLAGIGTFASWILVFRYLGFERHTVMLSAAILAVDYTLINNSAYGRMDSLSSLFGVLALVTYLYLRDKNFVLCLFGSQLFLMLSGLTHPMGGAVFTSGFVVLFVLNQDVRQMSAVRIAAGILPYLMGAAAWGLYIAQDPASFIKQFGSNTSGRFDGILAPWTALQGEFSRYFGSYGLRSDNTLAKAKLIIPVIYIAGALLAAFNRDLRRTAPVRKAVLMLGAGALMMMLIDNCRYGNYLIHIVPLYAILLASWVVWAWRQVPASKTALACGMGVFLGVQAMGPIYWIHRDGYHKEYLPLIQFVRSVTPAGGKITGPARLGFQLGFDDNLKDDFSLGYFSGRTPDVIVQDYLYWNRLRASDAPPAVHKALLEIMSHYRPVFSEPEYTVLVPVEQTAAVKSSSRGHEPANR
jgi:hypothetical protein